MSIAALSTTTLTNAIDGAQGRFLVASTTGINGTGSLSAPQSVIAIDGEAMLVQSVPISGVVEVIRGAMGTKARPHAASSIVYFGSKERFGPAVHGMSGLLVGLVGDAGNPAGILPEYGLPLGARRREFGKEYILCDFTATVHSGVTVSISADGNYQAAPLTSSHQGPVGVVAEPTSTSDQWGWVQIYGTCSGQDASATSAITSAYIPIVASSVSAPDAGLTAIAAGTSTAQRIIYNMFITGAATTNVTSAASHTGVGLPLFLNYPYVFQSATDPGFS